MERNVQIGTLKSNDMIDSGKILEGKFVIYTKDQLVNLIPVMTDVLSVSVKESTILDLNKYPVKMTCVNDIIKIKAVSTK